MEQKKKQEKAISTTGRMMCTGDLTVRLLNGKTYQVRTEYHGLDLQRASQEHQLVMLIKQHLPYNEIDTGWLVRTKEMDKEHRFGLKARKGDRSWAVYGYNDVVAWGYADGGLNSDHFNSCRMRPEEWPQFAGQTEDDDFEPEDWDDEEPGERRCVKFKVTDEEVIYSAVMGKEEATKDGGTPLMHACANAFCDLREKHPEVTEAHFYTDDRVALGPEE